MDADCYALEYMIRDRLDKARATAQVAALLANTNHGRGPNAAKTRFTDRGRKLVNGVRKIVSEISHAMPG